MVSLALAIVELEHCRRWWGMRVCGCRMWQWPIAYEWFWWKSRCCVAVMMH